MSEIKTEKAENQPKTLEELFVKQFNELQELLLHFQWRQYNICFQNTILSNGCHRCSFGLCNYLISKILRSGQYLHKLRNTLVQI